MGKYLPRIADQLLKQALKSSSAVLIEGSKWCGKTCTDQQSAKSGLMMQDPDKINSYLQTASIKGGADEILNFI
ncbi:MAG: hypothetical protein JW903_05715 [Clostridia bacterium]|nr:hypothetical protein [Clostridia bacterium]